jgi:hypothetical protein
LSSDNHLAAGWHLNSFEVSIRVKARKFSKADGIGLCGRVLLNKTGNLLLIEILQDKGVLGSLLLLIYQIGKSRSTATKSSIYLVKLLDTKERGLNCYLLRISIDPQ